MNCRERIRLQDTGEDEWARGRLLLMLEFSGRMRIFSLITTTVAFFFGVEC